MSANHKKRLREEATCAICLDFFKEPVTLECGHTFCKVCIDHCWGECSVVRRGSCPLCRQSVRRKNLKLNKPLANMVEITKELHDQAKKEIEAGRLCEQHHEPLKLFCEEDDASLCVVCEKSKQHRGHRMAPLEEAVQEYKDRISACLENLRKEREEILVYKEKTEKESQDLLKATETERQKISAEFRQLHQFLEVQEQIRLAQMKAVDNEIMKKRDEHLARLTEELSTLETTIQEMERKCQTPEGEVLQAIVSTVHRYERKKKFENPVAFPSVLKWKIWEFRDFSLILGDVIKDFKGTLNPYDYQLRKVNVTLDQNTAHPQILISEDKKCLTLEEKQEGPISNNETLVYNQCVLGHVLPAPSRCFWEVEVGDEEGWAVGLSMRNVGTGNNKVLNPDAGVWAIGKWEGQYRALIAPQNPPLSLCQEPKRIQVFMNHAGQQITFFDADTADLIYTFQVRRYDMCVAVPSFWLWKKSRLRLCP